MKYRLLLLFLAILAFGLQSCKKEEGCTDPNACNYNPEAEVNDGSCIQPGTWYPDLDGDGRADSHESIKSCDPPEGYVADYFVGAGGGNGGGGGSLTVEMTQRAIVPYVGATWCPPCGEFGENTKNHIKDNFTIDQAIILSSQQGDAISSASTGICESFGDEFQTAVGSTGIPHMYISGNTVWEDFYPNEGTVEGHINTIIGMEPVVGAAIQANLDTDNNLIAITAVAQFFQATTGEHHMSVLILEDEVEADQSHSSQGTVPGMPHDAVIRASADDPNIRGVSIGTAFTENQIIQKDFQIDLGNWDTENLRAVVLIWEGNDLQIANGASANVQP